MIATMHAEHASGRLSDAAYIASLEDEVARLATVYDFAQSLAIENAVACVKAEKQLRDVTRELDATRLTAEGLRLLVVGTDPAARPLRAVGEGE